MSTSSDVDTLNMDIDSVNSFEGLIRLQLRVQDGRNLLEVLRANRLAKRVVKCCNKKPMKEGPYKRDCRFGRIWRCNACNTSKPVAEGSIFSKSHLDPFVILKVAYAYLVLQLNNSSVILAVESCPSAAQLNGWLQIIRDILSADLSREVQGLKLGGVNRTVVIDDTALEKTHSDGGTKSSGVLQILGLYDIETKTGFAVWVDDVSFAEVMSCIVNYVTRDSRLVASERIRSICAATADGDDSVALEQPTISQQNSIKGYFSRLKVFLRSRAVRTQRSVASYLDEFMWRERHRYALWPDFLEAIRRQHRC